jgi:general secretion pathway protein I
MQNAKCKMKNGFSLLEVILAIAILTGAVAVLGELARRGLDCARFARDTSYALLLCESKIDEFASGAALPTSGDGQQFEEPLDPNGPAWLYRVEFSDTDMEGLISLKITVYQDLPQEQQPAECSLTRWIVDPGVEFPVAEDQSQTGATGTGTGGGTGTVN